MTAGAVGILWLVVFIIAISLFGKQLLKEPKKTGLGFSDFLGMGALLTIFRGRGGGRGEG